MKSNVYERTTLYEEVWTEPMGVVASRYGISDVMLKKICKQLDVPTPPRGYWAKLRAGQQPKKPKLPKSSGPTTTFGKGTDFEESPDSNIENALDSLNDEEQASLILASDHLSYKERIRLRESLKQLKAECGFPERILRINHPQNFSFCESISKENAPRALAATEAIARAVEQMGGSMKKPFLFEMLGECVELQISEKTRQVEHSITKKEADELKDYEENHKRYSWYSKPRIRKWDYAFTGMLSFNVVTGYRFECRESVAAASRFLVEREGTEFNELLTRVLRLICQACAAMRKQRLREQEEARLREIELQEARKITEAYNAEVTRFNGILEEARRYEEASILRNYAEALCEKEPKSLSIANWIRAKADWLDPLVVTSDPILGELSPEDYPPTIKPLPTERDLFPKEYRAYIDHTYPNRTWY